MTDDPQAPFDPCSAFAFSSIEIGNHAPDCDFCGAPYTVQPGSTITLDGTCSSDPDPNDDITYAWDLDNDGVFDDCSQPQCDFLVGDVVGTVYNIALRVTHNHEKYAICYTTNTIVEGVDCIEAVIKSGTIIDRDQKADTVTVDIIECNGLAEFCDNVESASGYDGTLAGHLISIQAGGFMRELPGENFKRIAGGAYLYYHPGKESGETTEKFLLTPGSETIRIYCANGDFAGPVAYPTIMVKTDITGELNYCWFNESDWREYPYHDGEKYHTP